ncbi:MAG: hypothetical protein FWC40_08990 [Proteobacteria bacterium]|nr:hypothetical protein [Pseudomonadota bacterium]
MNIKKNLRFARHTLLSSMLLGSIANASPLSEGLSIQRAQEENAFSDCLEAIASPQEAQACTDWIVKATCLHTFDERQDHLARLTPAQAMRDYLEKAEAIVWASTQCDPMAMRALSLRILARDALSEPRSKLKRWQRIFEDINKRLPEQRLYLCHEAATSPDLGTLLAQPSIRRAIEQCLDDMTRASQTTSAMFDILTALEDVSPQMLNLPARALLLMEAIGKQQYETARAQMAVLDIDALTPELRQRLLDKILSAAPNLMPIRPLADVACHRGFEPEASGAVNRRRALYAALAQMPHPFAVFVARNEAALALAICDHGTIARRLAQIYARAPNNHDVQSYTDSLIAHAVRQHDNSLVLALSDSLSTLTHEAKAVFSQKHGDTLASAAIAWAHGAMARSDSAMAERVLRQTVAFVTDKSRPQLYLALGLALAAENKPTEALQYWHDIIQRFPQDRNIDDAYYLSIVLLQKLKKPQEAKALLTEFAAKRPQSDWLVWLTP